MAAVAPIQPLAWKLLYAVGVALKKKKIEGNVIKEWTLININASMLVH